MPLELACCVEAPASYEPRAQYAIEALLRPLGLRPRWSDRADLVAPALYYGSDEISPESGILAIPLDSDTVAFFDSLQPRAAADVCWREMDGEKWPLLFGDQDIIASSFFWLAGWHEHTHKQRDQHGRVAYAGSIQEQLGIPYRPPVDAYREELARQLEERGVPLNRPTWGNATWAFCPTHDIDYLRKWRPGMVFRETMEYLILNRAHPEPGHRLRRFGQFVADWVRPGDAFRDSLKRILEETQAREGTGTYFFKAGAHGPRDVDYRLASGFARRQIRALQEAGCEVGLHPSYHAADHARYLHEEKTKLEAVLEAPVRSVRQHYLKYHSVRTPRLHACAGFQIDSTLAFADHAGFRRGTCHPFQLFDVAANTVLPVWEMPLIAMDGALFNRQQLSVEAANEVNSRLLDACRRYRGCAVMLWHNTLWDELDFPGWGANFMYTMDAAVEKEARVLSLEAALQGYGEL